MACPTRAMVASCPRWRFIAAQDAIPRHLSTTHTSDKPPLLVIDGTAAIVAANRAIKRDLQTSTGIVTTGAFGLLSAVIKLKRSYPTNPMLVVLERCLETPPLASVVDQLSNDDLTQQATLTCSSFTQPLVTSMALFEVANHSHPLPVFYRKRHLAYPSYKAHRRVVKYRARVPAPMLHPFAGDLLRLTGTPVLCLPAGIEADDAIASVSAWRDLNKQGACFRPDM